MFFLGSVCQACILLLQVWYTAYWNVNVLWLAFTENTQGFIKQLCSIIISCNNKSVQDFLLIFITFVLAQNWSFFLINLQIMACFACKIGLMVLEQSQWKKKNALRKSKSDYVSFWRIRSQTLGEYVDVRPLLNISRLVL